LSVGEIFERAHSCGYHTALIITRLIQTEQIKPTLTMG
jgi:hypothetical protein